jgi:F-type H+-transporting ATPase subunit c
LEILTLLPLLEFTDTGLSDAAKFIGAGIAIGVGGAGPAIAIGMLTGKALEALGRNPEASDKIQPALILGIALSEAVAIYALVVAVMIGFVF